MWHEEDSFTIIVNGCNYTIDQKSRTWEGYTMAVPKRLVLAPRSNKYPPSDQTEAMVERAIAIYNNNLGYADLDAKRFLQSMFGESNEGERAPGVESGNGGEVPDLQSTGSGE